MSSSESGWRMFNWVPDGVYDYREYLTRYVVIDGMPQTTITKIWLDKGGPQDVDAALRQSWGTFPDFPPKPAKK